MSDARKVDRSGADPAAVEETLARAYAALDFPAGSEPDWDRFNDAFHPAAVLALRVFPQDAEISVLGLRTYAEAQMRNELGSEGYSETPGACQVEVVGDVATARQAFTMNFAHGAVPAVDCFSLIRAEGRWLVVAVVSDVVHPGS